MIIRSGSMFFMLSLYLSNMNKEAHVIGSCWMDYKSVLFAARKLKARIEMFTFMEEYMVHLVDCLPSMCKALGWIPSIAYTGCGGSCLSSQHPGGEDRKISSKFFSAGKF